MPTLTDVANYDYVRSKSDNHVIELNTRKQYRR